MTCMYQRPKHRAIDQGQRIQLMGPIPSPSAGDQHELERLEVERMKHAELSVPRSHSASLAGRRPMYTSVQNHTSSSHDADCDAKRAPIKARGLRYEASRYMLGSRIG